MTEMSGDGGLREALARTMAVTLATSQHHDDPAWYFEMYADLYRLYADAVLALPEVAALRAKAAGYDRVEELADELDRQAPEQEAWDGNVDAAYTDIANRIRRALDGPPC